MSKIAVIGLGKFGRQIAETLTRSGGEVIAVDRKRDVIEALRDRVTLAVRLDSTDEQALRHQGVDQVDAAVVGIGDNFEAAILTVTLLRSFEVPRIICRADSDIRATILKQLGAHATINPEAESAARWSHRLMLPNLRDYFELGQGHGMIQISAPQAFCEKTPQELQLRQSHGVTLVAIRRPPAEKRDTKQRTFKPYTTIIPKPDTAIMPYDILVLVGADSNLDRIARV